MDRQKLKILLDKVRKGKIKIDKALEMLRDLPFEDIGIAKVDHHRALRRGFPEVIFCEGKEPKDTVAIAKSIIKAGHCLLATRVDSKTAAALKKFSKKIKYHRRARCATYRHKKVKPQGHVVVCCAGTSDIPVAEEAKITAEMLGAKVTALYDVGVAGIHRVLAHKKELKEARAIVVAAGMEGALASVVGGMVDVPVVAVPTSIGYGASFGGIAALLAMLNSCVPGVVVVNIDNGFGAGYAAAMINRK
ncbi:MAG: nickel pincer cofactor biosynthesis protein LarB [Planctomycetota bacterium]|nr:MAG: nickel pincer cofactor biosynthesis protein LarB [Planctomycetota bacterium]